MARETRVAHDTDMTVDEAKPKQHNSKPQKVRMRRVRPGFRPNVLVVEPYGGQ